MNLGSDVFRITNFGNGSGSHVDPHRPECSEIFDPEPKKSSRSFSSCWDLIVGCWGGAGPGGSSGMVWNLWGFRDVEPGLNRLCFGPMNQYSFEGN